MGLLIAFLLGTNCEKWVTVLHQEPITVTQVEEQTCQRNGLGTGSSQGSLGQSGLKNWITPFCEVRQPCYFTYHNTFNAMLQFYMTLSWGNHSRDVLISKGIKKWQREENRGRADTKHLAILAFPQWLSNRCQSASQQTVVGFFSR